MPTFPTYRGELPQCLNPLNLRHYFLLAYWIYFRPTALKCYLYQADPDLYRAGPGLGIFRTLRVPAYRNLYLMTPGVVLLFSILVGLPITLLTSWIQGTPINVWGWASGVAVGVAVGVAGGVAGGVAFGVAVSVAVSVAVGVAFGVAFGVAYGVAGGVASGVAVSVAGGVEVGVAFGVALGLGALRAIFYPFQIVPSSRSASPGGKHPLEWDEFAVLPLSGTRRALARRLQENEPGGLGFVVEAARNPFQRWVAQAALQRHAHTHAMPIAFFYELLANSDLDEYLVAPQERRDWRDNIAVRQLLLGELALRFVEAISNPIGTFSDRVVWRLTLPLRDRRKTPLTRLAGMLYELLDEKIIESDKFDLSAYTGTYTGLVDYPGGVEIARSFEAMAAFLSYDDLATLPAAVDRASRLDLGHHPVRPQVLDALASLGRVGAEIAAYRDATSRVNKLAALARATDALDDLDEYVVAQVMVPEQHILRRIIRQWRRLVSEAGGEAGRAEVSGPVANPYVLNNPVQGDLFVGREDVMRRLEELWGGEGQKPSLVLYGHRRMGKSSILQNLGARFGARTAIVDFNLQRVGWVANTGELLYNLALALYDTQTREVSPTAQVLEQPAEEAFTAHNPYTAFDRFLRQLDRARAGRRFIVTVDEFELIERAITEQRLEAHLLESWRGLIQTYPWFIMAFAGLHTLQEMRQDYWSPLFASVTAIPVSFLSHDAAWRLITQPTPDFALDYDADAVESIIMLTHGQPYLVQLICHGLMTRFNRQMFEENAEFTFPITFPVSFGRERRFTLADVEAVIATPEFYRDGDAYFTGVWVQAERSEPPGQTAVLRVLAKPTKFGSGTKYGRGVYGGGQHTTTEEIAQETGLALENVQRALETLARHDVVMQEDGRWKFTVELMRRWVAQSVKDDGKLDQVRI